MRPHNPKVFQRIVAEDGTVLGRNFLADARKARRSRWARSSRASSAIA